VPCKRNHGNTTHSLSKRGPGFQKKTLGKDWGMFAGSAGTDQHEQGDAEPRGCISLHIVLTFPSSRKA
jgi:hypothetical protein